MAVVSSRRLLVSYSSRLIRVGGAGSAAVRLLFFISSFGFALCDGCRFVRAVLFCSLGWVVGLWRAVVVGGMGSVCVGG